MAPCGQAVRLLRSAVVGEWFKRITNGIAIASIGMLAMAAAGALLGARINTTHSLAVGLYWDVDDPIEKGAYVVFCPPLNAVVEEARKRRYFSHGVCPGGYGHLMKRVLAVAGDVVLINDKGVSVNGALLPLSTPIAADQRGRPLHQVRTGSFMLGPSEVLLMSDVSARSFDGRYFGPVETAQVQAVVRPVITF